MSEALHVYQAEAKDLIAHINTQKGNHDSGAARRKTKKKEEGRSTKVLIQIETKSKNANVIHTCI